jgi:hypothetical protein
VGGVVVRGSEHLLLNILAEFFIKLFSQKLRFVVAIDKPLPISKPQIKFKKKL